MKNLRVVLCCIASSWIVACGKPPTRAPKPTNSEARGSYCERLQPLLDKTARQARIGSELSCLDVPGVTDLGRFGSSGSAEEDALVNCFDQPNEYDALVQVPDAGFQLSIEDTFEQSTSQGLGTGLLSLVPWLPRVELANKNATHLQAAVTIRDARFVTLVGVASKLQGQAREQACLEALCKPDTSYVHKALVGVPSVTIRATDESGQQVALGAATASANFRDQQSSAGSREITSQKPVTLAISRTAFRTPQTERLCQFCGKHGQTCCASEPACDGGLGCIGQRCVPIGGPGQPCDGASCSGGSMCVGGQCRLECGGKGLPCCAGTDCSGKLRCTVDPENNLEYASSSELVAVSGGFLGTDEDRTFGSSSCGPLRTRSRFAITKLGAGRGSCEKAWWFDPKNQKDCRVAVHFNVSTFGSIQCRVEAFASPPHKPDVCLP